MPVETAAGALRGGRAWGGRRAARRRSLGDRIDGLVAAVSRWRLLFVVLAAAALFLATTIPSAALRWQGAGDPDESNLLHLTRMVMSGQVPYRDFHWFMLPGLYYLLGGWLKVFGDGMAVERTAQLLLWGAFAAAVFFAVARRGPIYLALPLGLGVTALAERVWNTLYYAPVATAVSMVAALAVAGGASRGRRGLGLIGAGGALAVVALTTKLDVGLTTLAAVMLVLGLSPVPGRRRAAEVGAFMGAALTAAGMAILYFASQGALPALVKDSFSDPFWTNDLVRFISVPPPFPALTGAGFAIWAAMELLPLGLVGLLWPGRGYSRTAALIGAVGGLDFLQIYPRMDAAHFAFAMPGLLICLGLAAARAGRLLPAPARPLMAGLAAYLALQLWSIPAAGWDNHTVPPADGAMIIDGQQVALPRAAAEGYAQIQWTLGLLDGRRPLAVFPSGDLLYALTGRRDATGYGMLLPGNFNHDTVAAVVAKLRSEPSAIVVLTDPTIAGSRFSDLAPELFNYLIRDYQRTLVGGFQVYTRDTIPENRLVADAPRMGAVREAVQVCGLAAPAAYPRPVKPVFARPVLQCVTTYVLRAPGL